MLPDEKWDDNKLKISVVGSLELVLTCTMYVMIIYLTDVWKLNFTRAAAIINLYVGISAILTAFMGMKLIADADKDRISLIIVLSSVAYMAGFALLTMSTPPVFKQIILFYISIPLIALGVFGHKLVKNLLDRQRVYRDSGRAIVVIVGFLLLVSPLVALFLLDDKGWSIKFGIPIIFAAVGMLVFLSFPSKIEEATGINPSLIWKASKSILHIIPICLFFILMGVVSSLGQTYFIYQASHLDPGSGETRTYLFLLPVVHLGLKVAFKEWVKGCLCLEFLSTIINPRTGIAWSMGFATLCCITAAKVEAGRLGLVKSNGLIDKPEEIVPMSMGWMCPQFLFLGLADGLSEKCIVRFFTEDVLHCSKKDYRGIPDFDDPAADEEYYQKKIQENAMRHGMELFANAVSGVGSLFSVLLIYVVGEIKPTWFQDTLNKSRLDNYYWTLSALTAANLVLYVLVSSCWSPKRLSTLVQAPAESITP